MYTCVDCLVILLHESLLMSHGLLSHGYFCIPVTWQFPVIETGIIILLLGYTDNWFKMCGTECTRDKLLHHIHGGGHLLNLMGPTSTASYVSHASCDLVHILLSHYMLHACTCPVIQLHATCTVIITDSLYDLFIYDKVTWGWETWRLITSYWVDVMNPY